MMSMGHQHVPMSGHVEESDIARKLELYATSTFQVHSFVRQLDYTTIAFNERVTFWLQRTGSLRYACVFATLYACAIA